jgi:hypothetical protein
MPGDPLPLLAEQRLHAGRARQASLGDLDGRMHPEHVRLRVGKYRRQLDEQIDVTWLKALGECVAGDDKFESPRAC